VTRGVLRALAVAASAALATGESAAEQRATYLGQGDAARLFEQYDNDGYSLAVSSRPDGAVELSVRVSDAPLESAAVFPTGAAPDRTLPAAAERDEFARRLTAGATTQASAVERILAGLAARVRYDPDRVRRQEPSAVFAARRASCVGLSELAVDLLRRVGIPARTVQGVLRSEPGAAAYDPAIGGAYHRWIAVHYPDRGEVFSDPSASVNGVDARYLPFARRAYAKPRALRLTTISFEGRLGYRTFAEGPVKLRLRLTEPGIGNR
jgi:transglutaminase-like putative cysteine protease